MVWSVSFLAFKLKRLHKVSCCLLEGLQLVTRPGVFTVFDLYQMHLPLFSFEVVSPAQFPNGLM